MYEVIIVILIVFQVVCDDRESNLVLLSQLFARKRINENEWELLKAGFGVYLHVCEAKSQDPLIQVTNEVIIIKLLYIKILY